MRRGQPAHHLTTHGVIVGMTGSGKTGLGVVLLEEALLSGVPVLVLDPKGDMGNLLLTFPDLRPRTSAPGSIRRRRGEKGSRWTRWRRRPPATWREGLASWGIGPERIRGCATRRPSPCTRRAPAPACQ